MAKISKGVFDAGPIIHTYEINNQLILEIVKEKFISVEVEKELKKHKVQYKSIKIKELTGRNKDLAKFIYEKYYLELGEATSIALSKQERIKFFFTDDLDAREVAKKLELNVHGTLGLLLRAFRENIITKEIALKSIKELKEKSTLFLTSDLLDWITTEIRKYKTSES